MAAVIDLHTGQHLPEPSPRRPELTLLQGGRPSGNPDVNPVGSRVPTARTFLRRRIVVVAVVAVALVLALQAVGHLAGAAAEALDRPPVASGRVHVVEAGDTAWTIAAELAPGMDRRTAVDDLLALNGDAALRVGQELRLPASFG